MNPDDDSSKSTSAVVVEYRVQIFVHETKEDGPHWEPVAEYNNLRKALSLKDRLLRQPKTIPPVKISSKELVYINKWNTWKRLEDKFYYDENDS